LFERNDGHALASLEGFVASNGVVALVHRAGDRREAASEDSFEERLGK
jgi:hypothetical protein